jgi:hypothetical protein
MADFEVVSLQDAIGSLRRRPGLVIGPAVTRTPEAMAQVLAYAFKKAGDTLPADVPIAEQTYRSAIDALRHLMPEKAELVTHEIREGLRVLKPSTDLPRLARAGWSACISLTEDLLFEAALSNHQDSIPSSRSVTTIDHSTVVPSDRTVPIYKLLGNLNDRRPDHTLAISESELLLRQQHWNALLRTFPDYLQDAPLFLLGTESAIPLVRAMLSVLVSMSRPTVAKLLFLKGDATLNDGTVRAMCGRCSTVLADTSIRELCDVITKLKPARSVAAASQGKVAEPDLLTRAVLAHEDLISLVPSAKPDEADFSARLPAMVDSLFRPSAVNWLPFLHGLDMRRTITDPIKNTIADYLRRPPSSNPPYLLIHGEAGIGKSVLLKRVAVELSLSGVNVLWARRAQSSNWIRGYRDLATKLSAVGKDGKPAGFRFVIFCDDPWALGLDAGELMACFDRFPGNVVFVFSVRNTDYFTADGSALTISGVPTSQVEVPFELDDAEVEGLKGMLPRIGAVRDQAEAQKEVSRIPSRHAKDILCSLWYLIPETRAQLAESLRDEYCRLGKGEESISTFAQQIAVTSAVARRAYEYVTVTSHLDVGLPMEVLVKALQVNYSDWIDMTVTGRPLWGLLYDEQDVEDETVVYHTRNEIVTRVLLELVNGGGVGHAGEIRVLKELVHACDIGAPAYRSFVLDVLVRGRGKLSRILSYEQGLELYEIARKVLPYPDRVLEHHKGIWIHDVGRDYKKAYQQLEHALQCPVYPGAERAAPQEHIHTSMAAAVVQLVKQGLHDRETGVDLVTDHLRKATSSAFFNPYTSHVAANLLFELAQQGGQTTTDRAGLIAFSEALQEIEKAFQLIGTRGRGQFKFEKTVLMLSNLQRKILAAIPSLDQLQRLARELFLTTGNQIGFEAACRRMLAEATLEDRGRTYNKVNEYLEQCFKEIHEKGKTPTPELRATRVDLVIRWRLQRARGTIDWTSLRDDLHILTDSSRYREDLMKRFYYAVALFHCGDTTGANAIFAGLRRTPSLAVSPGDVRCYYLGDQGYPRRFQGTLERSGDRYYVSIPDLSFSVMARTAGMTGGPGATVHVYVGFTMYGPAAIFTNPGDDHSLLP